MTLPDTLPENFCPAPWTSIFYQNNKAQLCCADDAPVPMSPVEFLESKYLADIRKEFLEGGRPENCKSCWKNESQGLQSMRKNYISMFPNFVPSSNESKELLRYMEIRASNLCNMSCRMCWTRNSSQLEREVIATPTLSRWFGPTGNDTEINDDNWEEIKTLAENLDFLNITGGEPMIIKKYHDLLDHLITKQCHTKIKLRIYTNASVYNPQVVEKILKFRTRLYFSIDGVGQTAEYQRYGIAWDVVEKNLRRYLSLPIAGFAIHTTITSYNLLDFSSLAKFYNQLVLDFPSVNDSLTFRAHIAGDLATHYEHLPDAMRPRAQEEIEKSLELLQDSKFKQIKVQLNNISKSLRFKAKKPKAFVEATREMDQSRNQKFESVFGLELKI